MTSFTSSTSACDMCHILSLSVLRTEELETVAAFVKLLSDALEVSQGMSGHSPYMVVGGLRFHTITKVIPSVELYCVFTSAYQDGSCKPIPSEEDRGYYSFIRNCGQYKFRPATYRKTSDRLLMTQLKKIVKNGMGALPGDVSEIGMTETTASLVVVFKFRGGVSNLAVTLIPAIAGPTLPEGTSSMLQDLFLQEWEDGGPVSTWFLVPPHDDTKLSPYSWELVVPIMYDLVEELKDVNYATLLLTYVAEVRQWSKLGLQIPHHSIWAVPMSMDADQLHELSKTSLRDQLSILLARLRKAVKDGELFDFAVPTRNYLEGMAMAQRLQLSRELRMGLDQLSSVDHFLDTFVGQRFPLPLPCESKLASQTLQKKNHHENEMPTDMYYFLNGGGDRGEAVQSCDWNCTVKFPRIKESAVAESNSTEDFLQDDDKQSHNSLTDIVTIIVMLIVAMTCLGLVLSAYSSKPSSAVPVSSNTSFDSDSYDDSDEDDSPRHRPRSKKELFFPLP